MNDTQATGGAAPTLAAQAASRRERFVAPRRAAWRRDGLARCAVACLLAAAVALANLLVWRAMNPPLPAPDAPARIAGLAYNAFQRWDSPLDARLPSDAAVAADLRQLAATTPRLRTYSASEFPALPALAQQHGLKLALGVWLDGRPANNEREVRAAIDAAGQHASVERVIAGNETQLHGSLSVAELYAVLDRLRRAVKVPVSTAEPWHVWLTQPELAGHVDFITVHLLPYWEGVAVEGAVAEAMHRYRQVRERFPGKPVVIGEAGWPSGGDAVGRAAATPANQAAFVRAFLAQAAREPLDYYLMEAVDQPWKRATEGRVGAHWGLLDAARRPKFALSGPVQADPYWRAKAGLSSALAFVALLPFLLAFSRLRLGGRLVFAASAQAVVSFTVLLAALPLSHYLGAFDAALLLLLVPALAVMGAILLTQVFEFAELFWEGSLRGRAEPRPLDAGAPAPFVSIHLACCNEPPEMVIATLESLLALDWPALEVLVVDNNTADPRRWQPVAAHVDAINRALADRPAGAPAPRVRFFHLPSLPGYKAGALNFALAHTDPHAKWVGVVDADYVVAPGWLRALGGWFGDASVGAVQSPQAHREWGGARLARMMNWEYDGFFRIGMHHRHERDAVVQHGTMTLVRASALRALQGWSADCVCEDTELGLRLLQQRLRVVYVDRAFGWGLVPTDFAAYRRQRRRWAQGAMQILRCHAGALFGGAVGGAVGGLFGGSFGARLRALFRAAPPAPATPTAPIPRLTRGQRYHFIAGWLPWLGDALHLVFSGAAMVWTLGVLLAPQVFGLPIALFVVPLAVFFTTRLVLVPLLYWRRVACPRADIAGAAFAGMALSHSIARGVFAGLSGGRAVFEVTRKGPVGNGPGVLATPSPWRAVREEAGLLAGLLVCIGALAVQPDLPGDGLARWSVLLGLQALPYAAALGCALLCRTGGPGLWRLRWAGAAGRGMRP